MFSYRMDLIQKENRKRVQNHSSENNPKEVETDPAFRKLLTTDAVILAILTISSYLFHYFFEFGYLSYFDIPVAFISFNLPEMIPAIFFLVSAYLIIMFVLWRYLNQLFVSLPSFLRTILIFLPWLLIFVVLGFSTGSILLLLFGIFITWVIDPLQQFQVRSRGRIGAEADQPSDQLSINHQSAVSSKKHNSSNSGIPGLLPVGNQRFWMYIFFTALAFSFAFGRVAAVTRTSFPISDTSPRCVVVYATAERFICKPLSNNNEFEKRFIIFNIPEYQNIEFREEITGPLRPNSAPNSKLDMVPSTAPVSDQTTTP